MPRTRTRRAASPRREKPRAEPKPEPGQLAVVHPTYARFYEVIAQIPEGAVATYGQIARLAGLPGRARQVGYSLHALPPGSPIPWQRVINARGEISLPALGGRRARQRRLLEREGVRFNARGRVDLRRYAWEPEA